MKDYRKLCIELFGTDDEAKLRKIAGRLRGGRKKALSEQDIATIIQLQKDVKTTKEIAESFGVNENPTWEDFESFLEDRCFQRTRAHRKAILKGIGVDFFIPKQREDFNNKFSES